VSFLGGGSDFKDFYVQEPGKVISTAIDKYTFVIVNPLFDDRIVVNWTIKESVKTPYELKHELVREALLKTGILGGIEITTLADIPSTGSGLGSSSSILVGLLNALYTFKGEQVSTQRLAEEACEIEIDILKKPIGKQDQYIAAYGGMCTIDFLKDEVRVNKWKLSNKDRYELSLNLSLYFTGITRKSETILKDQKRNIISGKVFDNLMKIKGLAVVAESLDFEKEVDRDILGELLDSSWSIKKDLTNKISNPKIDKMYDSAVNAGAMGGKICGAGGGGFLLVYAPQKKQTMIRFALRDYKEMPFMLERDGSKVILNYRRYGWV
tara:strand:- start:876 stop:1847 length:972 start_codon:yes stop_codon:yes gene_type:complete